MVNYKAPKLGYKPFWLLCIWLVVWTPLKNISQLGWWHSQYTEQKMFQTTNQISTYHWNCTCKSVCAALANMEKEAANQSHAPWVSQQEYGFKSKNVALGMWGFTQRRLRIEPGNIGAGNENHRCQKGGEHVGTEVNKHNISCPTWIDPDSIFITARRKNVLPGKFKWRLNMLKHYPSTCSNTFAGPVFWDFPDDEP